MSPVSGDWATLRREQIRLANPANPGVAEIGAYWSLELLQEISQ